MNRQQVRKLLIFLSLLLFPVTLYYFSPVLVFSAALVGIVNGSLIVFCLLLVLSIFFGRLFCAYLCPAGGLQECAFGLCSKVPRQKWRNYIKYIIWLFWITAVVLCYIHKGSIVKIDFFFQTEHGISVSNISIYLIYYGIILLLLLPALIAGKRAFCHYFCWMAPFMVLGTKIRFLLHLPGLHLTANSSACTSCGKCSKACPMSLDIAGMAKTGSCCHTECIQCGACIDVCPKNVLKYSMKNKE